MHEPQGPDARTTYDIGYDARQEEVLLVLVWTFLESTVRHCLLFSVFGDNRRTILQLDAVCACVAALIFLLLSMKEKKSRYSSVVSFNLKMLLLVLDTNTLVPALPGTCVSIWLSLDCYPLD
jgi:hypothetical protein